ncbi:cuticlin-3-like isoform X1 [Tachypleus tridentatus]|uniref:cuticlin-3-like isoform X1 n=1 Tax=Tachypleus tridentatus TaxID=6853 RepID=UPI003FD130FC
MIRVEDITADCQDNYMRITIRFNGSFTGLIYSTGYVHDLDCIYVNGTGRSLYEFYIRQNRCGTQGRRKEDFDPRTPVVRPRHNEYLLNTVTVQYSPIIEEEWDEHFRVTCEHGHDFWKTVTFPVINVEVNTGNPLIFALNPPKCYMEILLGWTITGRRISGPVTVGDPLTLVIYMRSENSGFDIVVSNCIAHNGQQNSIRLVDKEGCVINEKLLSPFRGQTSGDSGEEVTLFAYFKAFRFTGSPALYLECDIHMCHGTCPHQQCYWRSRIRRFLEKRESGNGNPLMSESVNLYQTLEVRQADETGTSNRQPNKGRLLDENAVCFRTAGFATMITILLTSVVLAVCISLTMCFRMRKMSKHNTTAPLGAKDNYVSKSKTSF